MVQNDPVNHPEHYTFGTIEVIDYIKSTLGNKGCYNFCIGNAIKYISRAEHKGKQKEDLDKAIWYIKYALKLIDQTETVSEEGTKASPEITPTAPYHLPPNVPYHFPTAVASYCETCPSNPLKQSGGIYVGDSPCQWCQHSPFKITCSDTTVATNNSLNSASDSISTNLKINS